MASSICAFFCALLTCFPSLILSRSWFHDSIIPPWLDSFSSTPNITLRVSFHGSRVTDGKLFTLNQTLAHPRVTISGPDLRPQDAYSFVIVDPDAYNPATHLFRNVIQYIISNIPGSISPSQDITKVGTIVLNYIHPQRPTSIAPGPYGVHRYYNLLFKQARKTENIQNVTSPLYFSVRNFTATYSLGYPVVGLMFRVNLGA